MFKRGGVALVASVLGWMIACDAGDGAPVAAPPVDAAVEASAPPAIGFEDASAADPARVKVDILLIVDDSASMAEEQAAFADRFKELTTALGSFTGKNGAKLDYRIALTTTGRTQNYEIDPGLPMFPPVPVSEAGDDGRFRKGCTMARPWLEGTDPDLASNFACIVSVGTKGPGIEMPLQAMKLALVDRVADGSNGAFLRPDALLSVIVVTDADDCSRPDDNFTIKDDACIGANASAYTPVADYLTVLDTLKGGRERWSFAAIAAASTCESTAFGDAQEAVRLKDFIGQAGEHAVLGSICTGDLQAGLDAALDTFDALWKTVDVH